MSKLTAFISGVGENPKFIVFMAHSGVAATVLLLFSGWHQYAAAVIAVGLAGLVGITLHSVRRLQCLTK